MNRDKNSDDKDLMPIASNAESACHPVETDGENTAQLRASRRRTDSAKPTRKRSAVTSTNTKRNITHETTTVTCGFCGNEFQAKTRRAQYCNAVCRRDAWLLRNPERAAELAESDKARLRAHLESKGIAWVESAKPEEVTQ